MDDRSADEGVEMGDRRRIYRFPGGFLETKAYGGDDGGVYLELGSAQRFVMRWKPTCIGYLRSDVSGIALLWDQSRIREFAEARGFDFADMVIYDPQSGRPPLARLKAQATRLAAEAVIVPGLAHFEGGEIPGSLVRRLDVIAVSGE